MQVQDENQDQEKELTSRSDEERKLVDAKVKKGLAKSSPVKRSSAKRFSKTRKELSKSYLGSQQAD